MKGKILNFDVQASRGAIAGDDGNRYNFSGSEWKSEGFPKTGMEVDFAVNDGEALEIYLYSESVSDKKDNTLGIVSLASGIAGVLLAFCCPYIDIVLGITAVVCGFLAYNKKQDYAVAGIVLGALAIIIGIIVTIIGFGLMLL